MVQMMIPTYGQDAAKYKMLSEINMVDNWLYYISQGAGHGGLFLIMYAYFKGLPNAYAEAAKIDGAGPFAIFKSINIFVLGSNTSPLSATFVCKILCFIK